MRYILTILLISFSPGRSQDTLEINYSIVGMTFREKYDVVKIQVPPWLGAADLKIQIKHSIHWPGDPPPQKLTYIFVFKETDQIGDTSDTGAIYSPKTGFQWRLQNWKPTKIPDSTPSNFDLTVYNTLIDRIIREGSTFNNIEIRSQVATDFDLTVTQMDSICSLVKFWLGKVKD
jgi:hypothetical protein